MESGSLLRSCFHEARLRDSFLGTEQGITASSPRFSRGPTVQQFRERRAMVAEGKSRTAVDGRESSAWPGPGDWH
jgi:hypothetical protein